VFAEGDVRLYIELLSIVLVPAEVWMPAALALLDVEFTLAFLIVFGRDTDPIVIVPVAALRIP
jgi:hypothetical protein